MDTTVTIELAPIARDLSLPEEQLRRTVELLDEGNTVPFITRYRKDLTGGLDEEQIRQVQDRVTRARMLAERKRTILKSIDSQGKLTDALAGEIERASSTKRLEDLYLPFKPKKQTLATVARERGLEPLAREILESAKIAEDLGIRARDFIDEDKGLRSQADVLLGVGHLVAEHFSERAELRETLRRIVRDTGKITCCKIEAAEQEPAAKKQSNGEESAQSDDKSAIAEVEREVAETPAADAQPAASPVPVDDAAAETPDAGETPSSGDTAAPEVAVDLPAETVGGEVVGGEDAAATEDPSPRNSSDTEAVHTEPVASADDATLPEQTATPEQTSRVDPPQGEATGGEGEATASKGEATGGEGVTTGTADLSPAEAPTEAERQAAKAAEQEKKKQQRAERKRRKQEAKKRKQKQKESAYKDYFNFTEAAAKLPPHRILAINRGEKARVLRVKLDADLDAMRAEAEKLAISEGHPHAQFLRGCLKDALMRLIFPALERELRRELTDKAEDHAVSVFARNLRHLLLTQPVSGHRVLAIDPGFRSGCKLAALDEFGNMHGHGAIFLVGPEERKQRSRARLVEMIKMHKITVVAIGNGTACRESEHLVADVLANELKCEDLSYVIVNEAGASVYSTSPVGREELGKLEAAQRSAVSIGRRLLDPLSELVKINPANIGVGLYQHDMKAKHLQDSLDAVVESCVNYVGVDVNTASPSLLRYVSGLNQLTARRLYEHRQQHGPFVSREQLKDVPGVGEATYVQAVGFLKIAGGENPLDATWIHPESYDSARQVLEKLGGSVEALAAELNAATKSPVFAEGLQGEQSDESTDEAPDSTPAPDETEVDETAPETEAQSPPAETAQETVPNETVPVETPTLENQPPEQSVEKAPQAASTDNAATEDAAAENAATDDAATAKELPREEAPVEAKSERPAAEPTTAPAQDSSRDSRTDTLVAVDSTRDETTPSVSALLEKAASVNSAELAQELEIGVLLCQDILTSLTRPGRDPREDLPSPLFRREILKLEDLKPGMQLQGTVLNVVDFGAFVDIGLHDTGLVHISRLADRYIKDPHEVVGVGDTIDIWVMSVDKQRRRVQLTAIKPGTEKPHRKRGDRGRREKPAGESEKRPARRDTKGKRKSGEGDRRPRQRRDKRDDRRSRHERGPSKPFELQSKKEKKQKLTKAKKEGRKPLQTFGELAQFLTLENAPEEESKKPEIAKELAANDSSQVSSDASEVASGETPSAKENDNAVENPAANQAPENTDN